MSALIVRPTIPAMTPLAFEKVREVQSRVAAVPQVAIRTRHVLHGGMYARSICIPAGVIIVGVEIKIATILIVQGNVIVYIGTEKPLYLAGYNVLPASKGRKQAFLAETDTEMTMLFPTSARTVEEAERQFTDEYDLLASHRDESLNTVTITGE